MAKRSFTEQHWLNDSDPESQLNYLTRDQNHERKLRLFGVACCRRIWSIIPNDECRRCVDAAESNADGGMSMEDMAATYTVASATLSELRNNAQDAGIAAIYSADQQIAEIAFALSVSSSRAVWHKNDEQKIELAAHADLLREIFGNPFRPVTADESWLSSTAVAIAQGIYQGKAFDRLPILADALQDAGCENTVVLNHLRSDGTHVKGCWALDLVLGKGVRNA